MRFACRITKATDYNKEPGYRYTDSLRAGRSEDRDPVGARFSAPVQTGPEAHPASYTMCTVSFPGGKAAVEWRPPHPHLVPRLMKE